MEYIAIFNSIHKVMKAEKILKKTGLNFLLIPVPRSLWSDCGLALKFPASEMEKVEKSLEKERIHIAELYLKIDDRYQKIY